MVFTFVAALAQVLSWMIIARMIMSMVFPMGTDRQWVAILMQFLYRVTEPILAPLRRVLPKFGMLDLSPMVAIILITVVREVVRGLT